MGDIQKDKKTIQEIEKISSEYWEEIDALRKEQDNVIDEYRTRLEEKKRVEIRKGLFDK